MEKKVEVSLNGKPLFVYTINLGSLNGPPLVDRDYFDEARDCAVDDDLVSEENVSKLKYRFVS